MIVCVSDLTQKFYLQAFLCFVNNDTFNIFVDIQKNLYRLKNSQNRGGRKKFMGDNAN